MLPSKKITEWAKSIDLQGRSLKVALLLIHNCCFTGGFCSCFLVSFFEAHIT